MSVFSIGRDPLVPFFNTVITWNAHAAWDVTFLRPVCPHSETYSLVGKPDMYTKGKGRAEI